jgi:hypothetical protein
MIFMIFLPDKGSLPDERGLWEKGSSEGPIIGRYRDS